MIFAIKKYRSCHIHLLHMCVFKSIGNIQVLSLNKLFQSWINLNFKNLLLIIHFNIFLILLEEQIAFSSQISTKGEIANTITIS